MGRIRILNTELVLELLICAEIRESSLPVAVQ